MTDAIAALGALAHETRLQIFRALVQAGPAGMGAGDLARKLDVPPPTLSFHLRDLTQAGLTAPARDGRCDSWARLTLPLVAEIGAPVTGFLVGAMPMVATPVSLGAMSMPFGRLH